MTPSTPSRSRLSCQTSRAPSPWISQACNASRSSQEPGNCNTPQIIGLPDPRRSKRLNLVVLDQGVGEQLLAELAEPLRALRLQLDHAADVDVLDALEAERRQRLLDGLALGVEDALLGADQHARLHWCQSSDRLRTTRR